MAFTLFGLFPLIETAIEKPTTAVSNAVGLVMTATEGGWFPVPT